MHCVVQREGIISGDAEDVAEAQVGEAAKDVGSDGGVGGDSGTSVLAVRRVAVKGASKNQCDLVRKKSGALVRTVEAWSGESEVMGAGGIRSKCMDFEV